MFLLYLIQDYLQFPPVGENILYSVQTFTKSLQNHETQFTDNVC